MGYTIYAVIGTILEQLFAVAMVLWILPAFEIRVPLWGLACLMIGLLVISVFTYLMGRRALDKNMVCAPEVMIGKSGVAATELSPGGYVKIQGELWQASSDLLISIGEEIVVTGMNGFKLQVVRKNKTPGEKSPKSNR
jgi:membrane protein implicated in regulation of membrane protease activity